MLTLLFRASITYRLKGQKRIGGNQEPGQGAIAGVGSVNRRYFLFHCGIGFDAAVDPASLERGGWCEAAGIQERIPLRVLSEREVKKLLEDNRERAWRFWTVPAAGDPEAKTWAGESYKRGSAATWVTGAYDPDTNLLYWGTGNPGPDWNGDMRKGDNLFTNSVISWDPDNGNMNWYFQYLPGDSWDYDEAGTHIIIGQQEIRIETSCQLGRL